MMCDRRGNSLIECLLATSLSASVMLAAFSMLQNANAAFVWQEQNALLQENGRYALETIARGLHQLAYVDQASTATDTLSAIQGQDNTGVNGSDELSLHFAGSGVPADGNVINCAGFTVATAPPDQGWSIFYVARNSEGEPELRCKYVGSTDWSSQALVAGVESFQVLYGVDTDADGIVNQYLNASSVSALSLWDQIVALRIALLLRAARAAGNPSVPDEYALFGAAYDATDDPGTHIMRSALPADSRAWPRQLVQSTVYLRNTLHPQSAAP
jgi:type IV pilus assembly protein PilW